MSFSWDNAQETFYNCMDKQTPKPRLDRFAIWQSTSALGNALNVYAHVFLFALSSGRQILIGQGIVPELLCGPDGAYLCGAPYRSNTWIRQQRTQKKSKVSTMAWSELLEDEAIHIVVAPLQWFQYQGINAAIYRGSECSKVNKSSLTECTKTALRCPEMSSATGLDADSCVMIRAMQYLLPAHQLRNSFVQRALTTVRESWLGNFVEFELVLSYSNTSHIALEQKNQQSTYFFDPPSSREDASKRFAGAIHVRERFDRFMEHIQATGQHSLFICASQNVYNAHLKISHGGSYWPKSLFITSDIHGVCRFAHSIVNNVTLNTHNVSSSIVCIDRPPVHITKDKRQPLSNRYLSRLDDHQITLLQWYLLTRSRWLTHVGRSGGHDVCKSATREGTHHVHVPGNSFYGWALAASGLLPPRPQFAYARNCPCDINKNHISVWEPPP